jgi:flagellar biogenesis protein FliO
MKLSLGLACLLLVSLLAAAQAAGLGAVQGARVVLTLGAVAGLAWWLLRQKGARTPFKSTPRLAVVQRAGLSQRNGLALVEVDGRPFIIVHGEGFAHVRAVPRRVRLKLPAPTPSAQEAIQ